MFASSASRRCLVNIKPCTYIRTEYVRPVDYELRSFSTNSLAIVALIRLALLSDFSDSRLDPLINYHFLAAHTLSLPYKFYQPPSDTLA